MKSDTGIPADYFLSSFEGHLEVVALLINHGAEVTCKDKKGYTPLHAAASNGQINIVKHLLNLGVEVRVSLYSKIIFFSYGCCYISEASKESSSCFLDCEKHLILCVDYWFKSQETFWNESV